LSGLTTQNPRQTSNLTLLSSVPEKMKLKIKNPFLLKNLLIFFSILFFTLSANSQNINLLDTATVIRIVDGDTLKINYKGKEESIRLIGIDTPESKPNKKAMRDAERSKDDIKTIIAMGKQATAFTKILVQPGNIVRIEFDVQSRDKYKRLLGYIWLSNGKMLNEEIVKAGYANLMTYPPNVKYQERFLRAYREARENNRGLWNK